MPRGLRDRCGEPAAGGAAVAGGVRLLFVGRLERRKGVDVLLEAVSALIEQGHDVTLDLAGPDTSHTESDRTYREAFEAGAPAAVAERVSFAGPVSDGRLHELYAAAGRSLANGLP